MDVWNNLIMYFWLFFIQFRIDNDTSRIFGVFWCILVYFWNSRWFCFDFLSLGIRNSKLCIQRVEIGGRQRSYTTVTLSLYDIDRICVSLKRWIYWLKRDDEFLGDLFKRNKFIAWSGMFASYVNIALIFF